MNLRALVGVLIGVSALGGVAYAGLHAAAPVGKGSATAAPQPGAPVVGAADSRSLQIGSATSWPTVTYQPTGAADWSRNPAGWDYAPIGVRGGQ